MELTDGASLTVFDYTRSEIEPIKKKLFEMGFKSIGGTYTRTKNDKQIDIYVDECVCGYSAPLGIDDVFLLTIQNHAWYTEEQLINIIEDETGEVDIDIDKLLGMYFMVGNDDLSNGLMYRLRDDYSVVIAMDGDDVSITVEPNESHKNKKR
jgi:hypothetical protein